MSFADLSDKFDLVATHLKEGLRAIAVLTTFFKSYRRLLDSFGSALDKNAGTFRNDLLAESGVDTLSTAMSAIPLSLQKVVEQYSNYSQSLQLEVIEPLDLFYDHFTSTNAGLMSTGSLAFSQVTKARELLARAKDRYLEAYSTAEKADQAVVTADDDKLEKAKKQATAASQGAKLAAERYVQAVADYNTALADYEKRSPDLLESLQQSEESRIHFLKYTMEKFVRLQQKLEITTGGIFGDMSAIVGNVNSLIDIRVFVDGHKSMNSEFQHEEFLPYETWKREEDLEDSEVKTPQLEATLAKEIVYALVPRSAHPSMDSSEGSESEDSVTSFDSPEDPIDPQKMSKLIDYVKSPEGRYEFLGLLDGRRSQCLLSPKNLNLLADVFIAMLTEIEMSDERDSAVFFKIITLAQVFCAEVEGKRRYLNSFIAQHRVWSDNTRWIQTIEWVIAMKVAVEKQSVRTQKKKQRSSSGLFGTLKTFATKIPNIFQKEQVDDKAEKSSAFLVLSQFNFHMINLGLSVDVATELILNCCLKMHLDSERTCVLLAELQANQRSSKRIIDTAGKDVVRKSLKRREKERTRWGKLLPIYLVCQYLPDADFLHVLLAAKPWSADLPTPLLRLRMVRSDGRDQLLRSKVWRFLLMKDVQIVEYNALLGKINETQPLAKEVEDVIAMDVLRSFQAHPHIASENLSNILRTYAYYNNDIGYCQGMNYIAGNLYIQLQDEAVAFSCLVGLIKKFKMEHLLEKNLPKLKLFFYQLDRLVGILLPEVHEVFKEEMINSSHFSSPWFLTLFANVYQGNPRRTELLLRLWDLFLSSETALEGWKMIFKIAISILSTLQEEIISRKFEEIMGLLTGLHSHSASGAIYEEAFVGKVRKVKVTTSLLRDLESEYEHLRLRAANPRIRS